MADRIQGYTEKYLQTECDRLTKKAGSAIYLLNRSEIPAVLVECGFLSNSEEAVEPLRPCVQAEAFGVHRRRNY